MKNFDANFDMNKDDFLRYDNFSLSLYTQKSKQQREREWTDDIEINCRTIVYDVILESAREIFHIGIVF